MATRPTNGWVSGLEIANTFDKKYRENYLEKKLKFFFVYFLWFASRHHEIFTVVWKWLLLPTPDGRTPSLHATPRHDEYGSERAPASKQTQRLDRRTQRSIQSHQRHGL